MSNKALSIWIFEAHRTFYYTKNHGKIPTQGGFLPWPASQNPAKLVSHAHTQTQISMI